MAANKLGRNIVFPICNSDGTPFHDLVLHKATYDSVVMSLNDNITGEVYYKDNSLPVTMREYIVFKRNFQDENETPIKFTLVNPPVVVREGHVKDNGDLKGMTKYSFTFYHPMYQLSNLPFADVAVLESQSYLSEKKTFQWIGTIDEYIAKLNKNLEHTQWIVEKSSRFPASKNAMISDVLNFNDSTIADALKQEYDTWGVPYVVDTVGRFELSYVSGKRFKVIIGLPSNEIYETQQDEQEDNPFVFEFGKGVGLKNNSRTPRNNKIITRISGHGSEDNIPYGYPQIVWNGAEDDSRLQYPLYDGIVGGQSVKLIKHPFTRTHLMPSIYSETVNKKVNPNAQGYDPTTTLIDYYDAISSESYVYPNPINELAPSYESHEFDVKPELNNGQSMAILGVEPINNNLTPADNWDDTMDENGNYLQSYFRVTLPPLGFDIYACAAITQEMKINMRSGACLGCTFDVEVDWDLYKTNFYDENGSFAPSGSQRDLTLFPNSTSESITIILKKENATFGTLMPNVYQHPVVGDNFVILGISLPLEYISNAEQRLDGEMKGYMLTNNVYYYDYPLKFDEYFLATHTYILTQLKPNCIVRFKYYDLELELYVKQITIKYGDSPLPQYNITLTDNVEVVLNQIGQAVEGIEKLSSVLMNVLNQSYGNNAWIELSKKLSKVNNDTAAGLITFLSGLISKDRIKAEKGLQIGKSYIGGFAGVGGNIDENANAELESLSLRRFLEVPELRYNRISIQVGNRWRAPGGGIILRVVPDEDSSGNILNTGTIYLHLEDGEFGKVAVDDICMGIYHDGMNTNDNDSDDFDDSRGNFRFSGFFTTYFTVTRIVEESDNSVFEYSLRNDERYPASHHPCDMMHFVCYGNFSNIYRQSSRYSTLTYERYLYKVNDWEFGAGNIAAQFGDLSNLRIYGYEMTDYSAYLNNIYMTGRLEQIRQLADELSSYSVDFSDYVDVITIDDVGNVIGGLYKVENNTPYDYRIHSAITVRKNNQVLTICEQNETATIGKYKIYAEPVRCTYAIANSTIYITSIENIKDGIPGTPDDVNFDYDAMREMTNCFVNLTIDCEGVTTLVKQFPITIKHMSEPFVDADINNESSGVSWNTKTQSYIGLPIVFDLTMYHNNEVLDITSTTNVSLSTSTTGVTLSNSTAPTTPAGHTIYYNKEIITQTKFDGTANEVTFKVARITITAMGKDVPLVTNIDVTGTATYAGVPYERTLTHTINKSTDTNVYSLLPSVDEVVVSKTGSLSDNSLTCSVICDSSDDKHYTVSSSDFSKHNLALRYKRFYTNGTSDSSYQTYSGAVTVSSDMKKVVFYLFGTVNGSVSTSIVHDTEEVPVIANGVDGAGVEYVFWVQESWDGDSSSGMATPMIRDDSSLPAFQADNYKPYGRNRTTEPWTNTWEDEPIGVSGNVGYKYEFYAQRKKVNGVWQAFGDVHLWNKYTQSGSSPYVLDLSNDNSLINCDEDGTIIGAYETSEIMIFEGGRDAYNDFTVTITGVNITATLSNRVITVSNMTAVGAQVNVRAVNNSDSSIVLTAVYSIRKVFPGESTVIYSLQPSLQVIHKYGDNGGFIDTTMSVQVKKSVGIDTTIITTPTEMATEGLKLCYVQGTGSTEHTFTNDMAAIATSTLCGNAAYTTIYLRDLETGQKMYDRERICTVSDGDTGDEGPMGLSGCHERVFQIYTPGMTYRNDENATDISGIRYVDFMCIRNDALESGYSVYMCNDTHEAAASWEQDWNSGKWTPVSVNAASAYFNYIVAKNAHFEFGSSNQLVIYDSSNNIVGGLTGAIPDEYHEDDSVRIWAGGSNPSTAPFRVQQDGQFFADKAHVQGLVEIKNANEGLLVYDSNDDVRVQIVAGTVDKPISETKYATGSAKQMTKGSQTTSVNLTPTPIILDMGTLKAGAIVSPSNTPVSPSTDVLLHLMVTTNGGATTMRLTGSGVPEKLAYEVSIVTSNGTVVSTYNGGWSSPSAGMTLDKELLFGKTIIPYTGTYYAYVRVWIRDVNTSNVASDTFGGIGSNVTITTTAKMCFNQDTPQGTRIGTNGLFVNMGTNKSFSVTSDHTEIKYGNNRIKVDDDGIYYYEGSSYLPLIKKTRTITANYTLKKDDGVLFLDNNSPITLVFPSDATNEVKVISLSGQGYTIDGAVIRSNGTAANPFTAGDQRPRIFVKNNAGVYYEFYCSN